ncbi:TerD family protein [Magnetococcales bacterium HHB-1]
MAVSLVKGQKISLAKDSGPQLKLVIMGLGWDPVESKGFFGLFGGSKEIDLDASCVFFSAEGEVLDAVWYQQLMSQDGSVKHTGDNRTGDGEGDDEQIIVDLSNVPPQVKTLMFVVSSYSGQTFNEIANASVRLLDAVGEEEVAHYNLTCQGEHTALVMCKIYRHQNSWKLHAIGEPAYGQSVTDLAQAMRPFL